jgi:hypothetical protein
MYSIDLANKIYEVMRLTPWCNHWMPTRMHKFKKFTNILNKMQSLPNVVIRYSSDSISGEIVQGSTSSTIFSDESQLPTNATICRAYEHEGKCNGCRNCWDKGIETIAYPAHGRAMMKVIKLRAQ